jgi:4-amino-4-deoxychorismate lyase
MIEHATLINGRPTDCLSHRDRGLSYGDGVFETLAVIGGRIIDLDPHLSRLRSGLARLSIPAPNERSLRDEIMQLAAGEARAVLKLIVTRGEGGRGYLPPATVEPTRVLSLFQWPDHPERYHLEGIAASVCRLRLSGSPALAGIKHLNRLENVLASMELGDECQEGLLLDGEGSVIEGIASNVFLLTGNALTTPELSRAGVEGITRARILDVATGMGLQTSIKRVSMNDVERAETLFFSNSIIGIWPVRQLENRSYGLNDRVRRLLQAVTPGFNPAAN